LNRPAKAGVEVPDHTVTHIPLPKVSIQQTPFETLIDTPDHGVVGGVLPHTITIINNTNIMQDFSLSVSENSAFLVAGDKKTYFRVNPRNSYKVQHNLLPLSVGRVSYPKFELKATRMDKTLPVSQQERFVFIKPAHGISTFI